LALKLLSPVGKPVAIVSNGKVLVAGLLVEFVSLMMSDFLITTLVLLEISLVLYLLKAFHFARLD